MKIIDAHTHSLLKNAIVSINPNQEMVDDYLYSVGIHPWFITDSTNYDALIYKLRDERAVAVGECGLDFSRKDIPIELQKEVFTRHIEISEYLEKPMIIHCVRAHEQLLELHRKYKVKQNWIVHGFRHKPSIAKQLLNAGIYISLGKYFNAETAAIIPPEKLLIETDDSNYDIYLIAESVSKIINKDVNKLINEVSNNLSGLLNI